MALQSDRFRGDAKLEAAAASDPDHITRGAGGPHVGKIQQALVELDGASLTPDGKYGPATAAAVLAFKAKRQILNFQGKLDDIVGKKTMAALDAEILARERGGGGGGGSGGRLGFKIVDDTPFGPPVASRVLGDIVVRFAGGFAEGELSADDVLSRRLVVIYERVQGLPTTSGLFRNVLRNPFNGRFLLRVGRLTTTIGAASTPVFVSVASDIVKLLVGLNLAPGKIYIHGSSSGGRNAIDFAAHLGLLGFKPHLVAAVDAAFFQGDTPDRPRDLGNRTISIPNFAVNAGSAPNKHNFFQTLGNHARNSTFQGVLFTSSMKGEEIHGNVVGFQNEDLTRFLSKALSDDGAHIEAGSRGNREAARLIADDLLLKT